MTKAATGPENTPPDQTGSIRRLWRKLLPWVFLVILFLILFSRVPLEQVVAEFKAMTPTQIIWLSIVSVIIIIGVAVLDGTAMGYGFSTFGVRIRYREIILVRAAMMLLASIATLIGQAGLAALVARKYRVPAATAAGMVMFLFLVEIYGMIALATIALPVLLLAQQAKISPGAPILVSAAIILLTWPALALLILASRRNISISLFRRLRLLAFLHPFQAIQPGQLLWLLLLKTLLAAWQITITVLAFRIYGIQVPVLELFAFMPLAILVSSIPITPARLGTTQWSWVLFFGYLVPPAVLVAMSLLLQFLLNLARWFIGALVMPFIYKDLANKPPGPVDG